MHLPQADGQQAAGGVRHSCHAVCCACPASKITARTLDLKLGMLLAGRAVKDCPASMLSRVVLQANADVRLASLPSKRLGLFAAQPSLIARSDSNGEDLEAFAGAGEP